MRAALLLFIFTVTANAQWQIQDSHTTADLRGIDNVGNGIAWASGSNGTVLRTTDNGTTWQRCATPPDADKLDFRGVQAFDAQTAIVMSSGKGDLSRLYKTTDGCKTWKLVFTNPDKDGFWDAIAFQDTMPKGIGTGFLLGDPVDGAFRVFEADRADTPWSSVTQQGIAADSKLQGAFAASDTALIVEPSPIFGSGGTGGSFIYINTAERGCPEPHCGGPEPQTRIWRRVPVPVGAHTASSGIFSIATRHTAASDLRIQTMIAVGGDYRLPDNSERVAAFSSDSGHHWHISLTPPHGYRSAVAYDTATKTWITVGPNGTDISTDDGRNWRALRPSAGDAPDADKNWNALSLPFVVGPKGRIGVLDAQALEAK